MAIALRTLDDGAWISVNDSREVGVSDVWILPFREYCSCETPHVLLEGFSGVDLRAIDNRIVADAVGMCIDCGTRDYIESLPVGRIVDGEFKSYEPGSVQTSPVAAVPTP
ncbi:uncharacterized protein Nmag_1602 [Natrialba magadii ATCC 43099]|uniref:DUF8134 domain-containing protein n=1 Tax=Natrialba magadii (strain ATCC 43099 / DSM 3394 / CCM 3739 / CIP 104546 / IAM 13178 / JCM 8861 / NBRC 102185 / NCIMB 2190 / MS3) TaxID=547559 RepID=D3SUC0_NATMM|nr:hypothetical protein [Natrialba magadii]ADD05178.1 uncharacterized protein Nmag_1602 [Natrialba magadii ATCC 43099]ELY23216.1 hypothetical protein C500_20541 [Natrialba magadii ATCC 43099]